MNRHIKTLAIAAVLAFLVLGSGGCIFSPDSDTGGPTTPPTNPYPFAGTENQLMANFRTAYDNMATNVYLEDVLDDGYKFVFTDGSPYAPPGGWSYAEEVESVTSMFAGNAGYDEVQGVSKLGVQDIVVEQLDQVLTWDDVPLTDPLFPGARRALYDVRIKFYLDGGDNTITVEGQQLFYVIDEQVDVDGVMKTRWRLLGQQDLTNIG